MSKIYDIVVLGCTGFTGSLVCKYLNTEYSGSVNYHRFIIYIKHETITETIITKGLNLFVGQLQAGIRRKWMYCSKLILT